ncbi:MAG: hemolysin family protein [Nitriliruptoraceae bacterium]
MTTDATIVAVVLAVFLVLLAGFLAAVETVVTRLNVVRALRLREEHEEAPARAEALLWLTERRARSLDALLVVTVTVRVALATVAAVSAYAATGRIEIVVPSALTTVFVSLVLSEVVPRTLVLRHLEAAGLLLARPGRVVVGAAAPVALGVIAVGRSLVSRRHEVSSPHAGDDELREVTEEPEEQDGELEPEERAMIRSIFELADTLVREIMVPRPDVVAVPADATIEDVTRVAVDGGYSRLPVHRAGDVDQMIGIVYAKDLLRRVVTEPGLHGWTDLTRPATFVPETKRSDELLRELQADAVHLALVVDEYGEFVGLVTIEDILEEIVGEIVDEHDQEDPLVEPLDDGRVRIDARLGVDDLNELLSLSLPEDGWDTVGGLVFGVLGRVPRPQELIELDGTTIEVERLQGRRVSKVIVSREGDDGSEGEGPDDPEDEEVGVTGEPDGARGPLYPGPATARRGNPDS